MFFSVGDEAAVGPHRHHVQAKNCSCRCPSQKGLNLFAGPVMQDLASSDKVARPLEFGSLA